jgi:hypothetical protein
MENLSIAGESGATLPDAAVSSLNTSREYPCGCSASGHGDVPPYCSEHACKCCRGTGMAMARVQFRDGRGCIEELRPCPVCSALSAPFVPTGAGGNPAAFSCCEGIGKHAEGCAYSAGDKS